MDGSYVIIKVLNNNVLIATHPSFKEVVLIGKGLGFQRKKDDILDSQAFEKMFVLRSEEEQEQYKQLLPSLEEDFIETMNDVIYYIREQVSSQLNEHILVALTDHLSFAIQRLNKGMDIKNPFLIETKSLYPTEYRIAEEVVTMINKRLQLTLPEGETGFIALHIHSSISNKHISVVNRHSQLIHQLLTMIEQSLSISFDREGTNYLRLVRHLRFAIERVKSGEIVNEPKKLAEVLKEEYPLCYNLSWKIIKVMQQTLKLPVFDAEAVYLTMHLQRIVNKNE